MLRILRTNPSEATFEKSMTKIKKKKKTLYGQRLPTQFERKIAVKNKTHRQRSHLLPGHCRLKYGSRWALI